MNSDFRNSIASDAAPSPEISPAEVTLRLIATLPAPGGLEDRVHAGLLVHSRSVGHTGRVLSWPSAARPGSSWVRSAAAAAIVFVVAGGGWGVYSRVPRPESAKVIVMPHGAASGGFTNAGAMRTPQTLNGPVLTHPVAVQPAATVLPLAKLPAKTSAKPAPIPVKKTQIAAGTKAIVQPITPTGPTQK